MIREYIFFRPRKLVFDFFVIREICIYFRVIFKPTNFAGIIFHFFGNFSVIKARNLHQTRCKTCPFDELADRGLRTSHSDNNFEGLESAIMDKSLGTNLHFSRFYAHVRRESNLSCLTSPHPPYNVENYYLKFPKSDFQHCIGREGKTVTRC